MTGHELARILLTHPDHPVWLRVWGDAGELGRGDGSIRIMHNRDPGGKKIVVIEAGEWKP